MPGNLGGVVYGTILVATLLAAESAKQETYPESMGGVMIALLVYWLANSYAGYTGERVRRAEHFELAGFLRAAAHEVGIVYGGLVPLLVLAVCWALGVSRSAAISAAILSAVAVIVLTEAAIGIRSKLTGRDLLVQSAFGMLLGFLVIALRVVLQ